MTAGRRLTGLVIATSLIMVLPTSGSSQALLSDQKDAAAHIANAAMAATECGMSVDQELLDAAVAEAGLAGADFEIEPYRSALARAAQEAQTSAEASSREAVCERLDAMYGATGFRLPGILAR